MTKMIALAVAASLIVAACASSGSDDIERLPGDGTTTAPLGDPPGTPQDPASSGLVDLGDTPPGADDSDSLVPGGDLPPGVAAATEDLARYLDVSTDNIDWVSFEDVLWPDAALGCPQPDTSYTQAVVAGSLIVFEVEGTTYEYHAAQGSDPFLCFP
jgi:hypothetical protein